MNRQRLFLVVLGILLFGVAVIGCSDNPTEEPEEIPVELTAWLAESTIAVGDSVAVSYELTGGVATQWVMAQFVEPDGDVVVAGFQDGATTRYIPMIWAGEHSIFVRALLEDDVELSTSPPMLFTVVEE